MAKTNEQSGGLEGPPAGHKLVGVKTELCFGTITPFNPVIDVQEVTGHLVQENCTR